MKALWRYLGRVLAGADGRPSSQRTAAFVGLASAIGVTVHGLHTGKLAPDIALGLWLAFVAAALGFAMTGASRYWAAQASTPPAADAPGGGG